MYLTDLAEAALTLAIISMLKYLKVFYGIKILWIALRSPDENERKDNKLEND